ncbi:hypothetical protein [Streptomyces uncialis]|uniref:hypothetical protein n=1 Tax=Streptomyces uncialis TaxID=1048205 RepID=UPI003863519B|nr:hypothetical protein OG268_10145 [Streptomyces uncialis]
MQASRKRLLAFTAVTSSMMLAGATAYFFDVPPFASRGKIDASKVCEVLGTSEKLAPALRTALPKSSEYSFRNREKSGDLSDRRFSTFHCFVRGEDGSPRPFTSYTEMMLAEGPKHWIDNYVNQQRFEDHELSDFKAGDKGVASIRTAGISVPCIPDGKVIGGQYNLSTVVTLKQDNDSDDGDTRQALIDIARSAAEYAHKKAKCELPSKL